MILGGFEGMLPRKSFENVHTVMGILAVLTVSWPTSSYVQKVSRVAFNSA